MPFLDVFPDGAYGLMRLLWVHGGALIELGSIPSGNCLDVVRDVLLLKEVVDAGLAPADLHLRSLNGPPIEQLSAEGWEQVVALPFDQLVEQLRLCVRKVQPPGPDGAPALPTETAELLRAAAFHGSIALVRLLLLLTAPNAFLDNPEELPEVFEEARVVFGHEGNTDEQFALLWSPLHTAAAGGSAVCASALLQADRRLANRATMSGWLPAHVAAWHGHAEVLRLLLEGQGANAAVAENNEGYLPLHCAAAGGRLACVQLLLAAAPDTVSADTNYGDTTLTLAAMCMQPRNGGSDHMAVVQLLLAADPQLASEIGPDGMTAVACCACSSHGTTQMLRLLLQAHPEGLLLRNDEGKLPLALAASAGNLPALEVLHAAAPSAVFDTSSFARYTPLHDAAVNGQPDAVSFLLEVAPETALFVNKDGCIPLSSALTYLEHHPTFSFKQDQLMEAARRLLPAVPAATALSALAGAHEDAKPLVSAAITCHLPLSPAAWSLVPSACPGFCDALPAVLRHGHEQAGQLVRRLRPGAKARLRTAVLCMARAQRLACATLPQDVLERILGDAMAD